MKRTAALALTVVTVLAVGSITASASGDRVGVDSIVKNFKFNGGNDPYYEQATFKGKVKGDTGSKNRRKRCGRKRQVKIVNNSSGAVVGKTKTNKKGEFKTGVNNKFVGGKKYVAKVARREYTNQKKGRGGKVTIVCRDTTSKVITAG